MDPQSPRAGVGVTDSLRSLLDSAMLYVEARLRLARLEGREALRMGLGIAALAILTLSCLMIAYACGLMALTLWIAHVWWQGSLIPATLIVALGHLVPAIVGAAWLVHASRGFHVFDATLNEFTEDKQWLHANQKSRT